MRNLQEIINLDDRIFAVLYINSNGKILNSFFSDKHKIDDEITEYISKNLYINNYKSDLLGNRLWDILEFDNIRITRIHELDKVVIVLSKSNLRPEEVSEIIIDYWCEMNSNDPESLF
ncbi:MAG: hypothetical protein ACPKPY_03390 [Nitrososphaeraceae archaeon]